MEKEEAKGKDEFTRRDLGTGLAFLGALLLLMTAFLYIMSALNSEQYVLFAGPWHLTFYTVLGAALIIGGWLLAGKKSTA